MGTAKKETPGDESVTLVTLIKAHMAMRQPALSQADVVRITGIPQASLSKILLGKREMDVAQFRALAKALGMTLSVLIRQGERAHQEASGLEVVIHYYARGNES